MAVAMTEAAPNHRQQSTIAYLQLLFHVLKPVPIPQLLFMLNPVPIPLLTVSLGPLIPVDLPCLS